MSRTVYKLEGCEIFQTSFLKNKTVHISANNNKICWHGYGWGAWQVRHAKSSLFLWRDGAKEKTVLLFTKKLCFPLILYFSRATGRMIHENCLNFISVAKLTLWFQNGSLRTFYWSFDKPRNLLVKTKADFLIFFVDLNCRTDFYVNLMTKIIWLQLEKCR